MEDLPDDMLRVIVHEHLLPIDLVLVRLVCRRLRDLFQAPSFESFLGYPRSYFDVAMDQGRYVTALIFWRDSRARASAYERYAKYHEMASRLFSKALLDPTSTCEDMWTLYAKMASYGVDVHALHRNARWLALNRGFRSLHVVLVRSSLGTTRLPHMKAMRALAAQGRVEDLRFILDRSGMRPCDMTKLLKEEASIVMQLVYEAAECRQFGVLVFLGQHYPGVFASRNPGNRRKMRLHFEKHEATPEMMQWLATVFPATRASWHRELRKARRRCRDSPNAHL
jgi:hypothetical protein